MRRSSDVKNSRGLRLFWARLEEEREMMGKALGEGGVSGWVGDWWMGLVMQEEERG